MEVDGDYESSLDEEPVSYFGYLVHFFILLEVIVGNIMYEGTLFYSVSVRIQHSRHLNRFELTINSSKFY